MFSLDVLPNEQPRPICAKTPLRLVLQGHVRMLLLLDVEGLKEFAEALDWRIEFCGPPAIAGTIGHVGPPSAYSRGKASASGITIASVKLPPV
jgi:hypothetical protein